MGELSVYELYKVKIIEISVLEILSKTIREKLCSLLFSVNFINLVWKNIFQ